MTINLTLAFILIFIALMALICMSALLAIAVHALWRRVDSLWDYVSK